MKASYRKLEGANVARMEGDVSAGTIEVTYMNGYKHTFGSVDEVESAEKALYPSRMHTPILGALFFAIIGC
tara:strand:- start:1058 stop:1270 length:213 start_codon:yes stop_codon:yes gene_type:complete